MNSPCICSGSRREIDTASGTFTLDGDYLSVTPIEAQTDSPNRSAELKGRFGVCTNEQGLVLVRPADEDIPADLTLQYRYRHRIDRLKIEAAAIGSKGRSWQPSFGIRGVGVRSSEGVWFTSSQ